MSFEGNFEDIIRGQLLECKKGNEETREVKFEVFL